MKEYPEREIFAYGRYIQCQILNWSEGPPPRYIICNPLDARYREEFIAHQAMGTWAQCDLRHVVAELAATQEEIVRLRSELAEFDETNRLLVKHADIRRAELERLRAALIVADEAIAEYIRYLDGGETRGSYDGRPERDNLRKAGHTVRASRSLSLEGGGS